VTAMATPTSRVCFVIMPFSGTKSCTEQEWTEVFEQVFKPAIEGAGLGYECRRSNATRGNIVAGIIRDLNDAHVVLADLTDRNANVFYELGVRHALTDRSIIVAQQRDDIPFDLSNYASHVYDWRSARAKEELVQKLRAILRDIDSNPKRPDNPVSDFLEEAPTRPVAEGPDEPPDTGFTVRPFAGPGSEALDIVGQTRVLARKDPVRAAKEIRRKTRPILLREVGSIVQALNRRNAPGPIQPRDIPKLAQEYLAVGEPAVQGIEKFALTSVEVRWKEGVIAAIAFAGDLITMSESTGSGYTIRFATGLPALLAWRLLILTGAKSLTEEAYDLTNLIINHPIESERHGRFSHRPLRERRNLFYSEAFLGYANFTVLYLQDLWDRHAHIQEFFGSKEDFEFSVAQFLMLVSLTYSFHNDDQFYPGYRLLLRAQALRAMSALSSRLAGLPDYRNEIATIVGLKDGATLQREWPALASRANEAKLGSDYLDFGDLQFPTQLGDKVEDGH
jgi:hypothetical protein